MCTQWGKEEVQRQLLLPAICFGGIHWTGVLKLLAAVRAITFANDVSVIHIVVVQGVGCL